MTGQSGVSSGGIAATSSGYDISSLLGGYDYDNYYDNYNYSNYYGNSYGYDDYSSYNYGSSGYGLSDILGSLSSSGYSSGFSSGNYYGGVTSASWDANTGQLNTEVAGGARNKFTTIKGNGRDTVTLMVYMCASDLESSGGAATMDIQEMLNASANDNVNILLYTGGTKQWQNNVMNASTNEIYQIANGQLYRLETDLGDRSMSDDATLTDFINYCSTNFPANRNMLILWDHGGGSVAGYAYDERHKSSGYMSLTDINNALKNAGVKFDFIGFDACLMASLENALMLSDYADYLIASEEVEPSAGWYYTDWLNDLSDNTSISTLELGKSIIDSFVTNSSKTAYGIGCTLSLTDLAELDATVPDKLEAFSTDISNMIDIGEGTQSYTTVINARTNSKEFGETQSLDQIDLVNFAANIGNSSGEDLSEALKSAIKYNQVSNGMSYSYGLSIFFPYRCTGYVSTAASIYEDIDFPSKYTECIQKTAAITGTGQSMYGTSSSNYNSLLDALLGSNSYEDYSYSTDDISGVFSDMLFGRSLEEGDASVRFLAENHFDADLLEWTEGSDGGNVIRLPEEQWNLVTALTLNTFYDDGEGFIALGKDNYFELDDEGNLKGEYNGTWLSIDGQLVPYYYDSMTYGEESSVIRGHVSALINGESSNLIIIFDNSHPQGYIAGAGKVYDDTGEDAAMISRIDTHLKEGDSVDFVADYYTYDGEFEGQYMVGEQWSYRDGAEIENIAVEGDVLAAYAFTDIYGNEYMTPRVP